MNSGPIWLFRIGQDGNAREIASRVVRPGYDIFSFPESHLKNFWKT